MTSSSSKSYAIIGRGIAGLTAAYHLVKNDIRPDIYGLKEGASRAAQGILCNKGLIFADSPLFRAKLSSLGEMKHFLDELEHESGLAIPRVFQGVSEPVWSQEDYRATVTRVYKNRFWGLHRTDLRTNESRPPEALKSPLLSLYYPEDGWFDPRAVLDALESFLLSKGVAFHEEEIHSIEEDKGSIILGGKAYNHLIMAAGAGSERLWNEMDCKALKMFLIGGQTLEFERAEDEGLPSHFYVKGNQSVALTERRGIVGSTSWLGFESEDLKADEEKLRREIFHSFGLSFGEALSRKGTRMRFKDRMPIVGWLNTGKFAGKIYLLTGFYRNGMHLAEICAREMICDILGKSEERRYPEFSALRFSV